MEQNRLDVKIVSSQIIKQAINFKVDLWNEIESGYFRIWGQRSREFILTSFVKVLPGVFSVNAQVTKLLIFYDYRSLKFYFTLH